MKTEKEKIKEIKTNMFLVWLMCFGIFLYVLQDILRALAYEAMLGLGFLWLYYAKVKPREFELVVEDLSKNA